MANLPHIPLFEQHLHNIKSNFNSRLPEFAKVIDGGQGEEPSFPFIYSSGGPGPILRGARLDFDKYQAIPIAKNQVDLPAFGAKVSHEELQSERGKMAPRRLFSYSA